jgi:uncharacterized protein YukE
MVEKEMVDAELRKNVRDLKKRVAEMADAWRQKTARKLKKSIRKLKDKTRKYSGEVRDMRKRLRTNTRRAANAKRAVRR